MRMHLQDNWRLTCDPFENVCCRIPGSVYTALVESQRIPDPFWGRNAEDARALMEHDSVFETCFDAPEEALRCPDVRLRFHGLDTIAEVSLNGQFLGRADNMHAVWEWPVTGRLRPGKNRLRVDIRSPLAYIREKQDAYPLWGPEHCADGFPHIRKPHYMFGWDWGPCLPDMGIWKPVELIAVDGGLFRELSVRQIHENGRVRLLIKTDLDGGADGELTQLLRLIGPDGSQLETATAGETELTVERPQLWWPNGYGEQPLYTLEAELRRGDEVLDTVRKRIGLRTLTVSTAKDAWGREFCFVVNGCKIFAMGADYVPEDNLLPRVSRERTEKLLRSCKEAHFNCVRVWGGGHYATDDFLDLCDELGLVVWQDFLFACCTYRLTPETRRSVEREVRDNLTRIRHHACLGLLCGNNEMEIAWTNWGIPQNERLRQDYIELYERWLPELTEALCPDVFYWPASPSSGGGFVDANGESRGDAHYWEVWLGGQPFEDYRKHYFRFCSEFGFESFPSMEAVRSFAPPEEWNPFSPILENHQKCSGGNAKILTYLADNYRYPYSFPELVYVSQLVQADAIQAGVEHMRRNRGRCMGAIYWQLNDCWPAASWSGIDSVGQWKALHYRAREFFAPVLLSAETDGGRVRLYISNETRSAFAGSIQVGLYENDFTPVWEDEAPASMPSLSAGCAAEWDLSLHLEEARDRRFFRYALIDDTGTCLRRAALLFVKPKHYRFARPELEFRRENGETLVRSDVFVKGLFFEPRDGEHLPVNFIDLTGPEWVRLPFEAKRETRMVNTVGY